MATDGMTTMGMMGMHSTALDHGTAKPLRHDLIRRPFSAMEVVLLDRAIADARLEHWSYQRIAGVLRHLPREQLLAFSRLLQRGTPVRAAIIAARTQRPLTRSTDRAPKRRRPRTRAASQPLASLATRSRPGGGSDGRSDGRKRSAR